MMPVQLCPRVAMRCAASVALYPGQRHAGSHHSAFGSFAQLPSHHSAVAVSTTLLHVVFASPAAGEALKEEGAPEPSLRPVVVFSRKHRNSEAEAHKRLKKPLFDYGLDIAPGVTVYADASTHSLGLCGHMINDPRGTGVEASCFECPIGGGALIGILTLRDVRAGEELLMDYGERYWQARTGQRRHDQAALHCYE